MARTLENIQTTISNYRSALSKRETKYTRNWNRYVSNGARRDNIWQLYGNPLAYFFTMGEDDTGILPTINVIRSCVETIVSKISQTKVRPFFNPINASFNVYKVCKNAQVYFDYYFQEENVYRKAAEALRDAEIFEIGILWIDEAETKIKKVSPWQFYFDQAEYNYDKQLSKCFLEFRDYPVSILMGTVSGATLPQDILTQYEYTPDLKVTWTVFYDLMNSERIEFCNDRLMKRYKLQSSTLPFEFIWSSTPVKGGMSTSMVDNLLPIQIQIDTLTHRIHTAIELNPANSIFLPQGALGQAGTIKKSMISNKIGNVYEYDASVPGNGAPVVSTPRPIDESYQELAEFFINKAYEMEGISTISAQGKKPGGVTSGVMLDTLQDVESERHNVILSNYTRLLMGAAIKMIDCFRDDALVIPERRGVKSIVWKDVKAAKAQIQIQFGEASVLSNDPATKMAQVEKLISMNILTGPEATKYLEFPDLEGAYSVMNASLDDVQAILERAVENEDYSFYEVVNVQELYQETVNMILRLDSNNEKPEVIGRLVKLLDIVNAKMDGFNQTIQGANPASPPPPVPLQGPQITAIAAILDEVRSGGMNANTASGLISLAVPGVPAQAIQTLVASNAPPGSTPESQAETSPGKQAQVPPDPGAAPVQTNTTI